MKRTSCLTLLLPALLAANPVWSTGEGVELTSADGLVALVPFAYLTVAAGDSTGDPQALAAGSHDPFQSGFTLQGLETGGVLRIGESFEAVAIYRAFLDAEDEFDGEFEEAFVRLRDPIPGTSLRLGRTLVPFGFLNNTHQHEWDFVDTPLALGRILGDHNLTADGGEVSATFGPRLAQSTLSFGVGVAPSHDHDHGGHGEEHNHDHGDHDHEEHEHGDHEEEEHQDEGHGHDHAGEEAAFDDLFLHARWKLDWIHNDFHRWSATVSGAWGDNSTGELTSLYGIGLSYLWRENGYEAGGKQLRWTTEVLYRDFSLASHEHEHEHEHDHEEEHGEEHGDEHGEEYGEASGEDFGVYSSLTFSPSERLSLGARLGYIGENTELDAPERWRVSPVVTLWNSSDRRHYLRLQSNHDFLANDDTEHSVWLQVGLGWGGHAH